MGLKVQKRKVSLDSLMNGVYFEEVEVKRIDRIRLRNVQKGF